MQGDGLLWAAESAHRFLTEYRMHYVLSFGEAFAQGLPDRAEPTPDELAYLHQMNDIIANLRREMLVRAACPGADS